MEESHAVVSLKSNNSGREDALSGRLTPVSLGLSVLPADLHPNGALQPDYPNALDFLHRLDKCGEQGRLGNVMWGRTTLIWDRRRFMFCCA